MKKELDVKVRKVISKTVAKRFKKSRKKEKNRLWKKIVRLADKLFEIVGKKGIKGGGKKLGKKKIWFRNLNEAIGRVWQCSKIAKYVIPSISKIAHNKIFHFIQVIRSYTLYENSTYKYLHSFFHCLNQFLSLILPGEFFYVFFFVRIGIFHFPFNPNFIKSF